MFSIGELQKFKNEEYYIINSYFYNDHDIKLMGKWSYKTDYKWDHFIVVYNDKKGKLNFIRKNFSITNDNFTIHELPDNKSDKYPIRAILVPNKGYDKEVDIKNLKIVSDIDLYKLPWKQIYW